MNIRLTPTIVYSLLKSEESRDARETSMVHNCGFSEFAAKEIVDNYDEMTKENQIGSVLRFTNFLERRFKL